MIDNRSIIFIFRMFIKPFRVKSSTQMKGSDKKKFKADIRKRFAYFSDPDVDMDLLNDLMPNKEDLMITKVETFSGEAVYLYQRKEGLTLFFELEKDKLILPTLYTLWQCPSMLPAFSTHPPVVQKIANGADLMLPGVVVNESLGIKAYHDGNIRKGDPLSINLVNNKACVAVGTATLGSEDMYMSGRRGKAVVILHCYGDQLWAHNGKQTLPELGVPESMEFLNNESEDEGEEEDIQEENGKEELDDPILVEEAAADAKIMELVDGIRLDESPAVEDKEAQPMDMDSLLEDAFLRACKTTGKKAELPILTSNFYRLHILPACPPTTNLDIKKTKYKKLSKFLAEKQAAGVITIKEPKKGVETITAINQEHPEVITYRVVKYDVPEHETVVKKDQYSPPVITELNIVTGGDVAGFFKACKVNKGCGLTTQEVRECVRSYVNENGLQHPADKTIVTLDPVLAEAVLVKGENNVLTFKWEKLHGRITTKMTNGYAIEFGNGAPASVFKGKIDLIEMIVGTRSGNKKVTLIHNLDVFGIKPSEFSHKCQVGVAASSTINEAPNKKKSNGSPVIEVLVQGNQVTFVAKLLLDFYKIPKKYIRGIELADKKAKPKGKK
jgi:translation initiation factor 2D